METETTSGIIMAPLPNDQQYSVTGSSGSFKMTDGNNADFTVGINDGNTTATTLSGSSGSFNMTTKRTTATTTTTTTTTPNDTPNTNTNTVNTGLYLRWSRIIKTVTIKADNSGLLRGSIAAPTKESNESFIRRRTNSKKNGNNKKEEKKNILKEVSGYAAPGEIVAMMG